MVARTRANKRPIAVPANKISRALCHCKRPLSRWLAPNKRAEPGAIISTETGKDHLAKGQLFDQGGDEYGGDEPGQGPSEFKEVERGRGNEMARGQQPNGQAPNDG